MNKILYVDDEYPNRIMFQLTYRNELDVLLAESADEALQLMGKYEGIGLVITDMRMPVKNGLEFVEEARQKYPDVTYCLLTGFGITQEIQEALDANLIDRYFKKPFDKQQILEYIKGVELT